MVFTKIVFAKKLKLKSYEFRDVQTSVKTDLIGWIDLIRLINLVRSLVKFFLKFRFIVILVRN